MSITAPMGSLIQSGVQTGESVAKSAASKANFMAYLEQNPIAETLFKDVTGYNLPRLALVRSPNEFWDTLTGEVANTSITLSGTLALPPLYQRLMAKMVNMPLSVLRNEVKNPASLSLAAKAARLGTSLGYLNFWGSLFWAAPFFRNWLTLTRSKTASFENLIGLEKSGGSTANDPNKLKEAKQFQLKRMAQVIAAGAGLSAASMLGFGALAKRFANRNVTQLAGKSGKALEWFFHHFDLKGQPANQVAPMWATLIYWSLPAYFGWLQASRSNNEYKENLLKTINSNLWFFFLQPMVNRAFLKAYQNIDGSLKHVPSFNDLSAMPKTATQEKLLALKNKQFALGLGLTVTMLAATPQIINRILTKKRFEKARLQKEQQVKSGKSVVKTDDKRIDEKTASLSQTLLAKNTLPFEHFLLNNR